MQAAHGDVGPNPPPATLMASRRDFIKDKTDFAKRFMRAIFDANEVYAKHPAEDDAAGCRMEWTGREDRR